jgi:hypothetical protein
MEEGRHWIPGIRMQFQRPFINDIFVALNTRLEHNSRLQTHNVSFNSLSPRPTSRARSTPDQSNHHANTHYQTNTD